MIKHRFEKGDLIGIVLGLLLIALMALLLYFCVMSFEIQQKTAYADSTDGVVEDNLFDRIDLRGVSSGQFTSQGDQLFSSGSTDFYLYNVSNNIISYNSTSFTLTNSNSEVNTTRFWFDFGGLTVGESYTFSACINSDTIARLRVRNGDGNNIYGENVFPDGLTAFSLTFTYSGSNSCRFLIYWGGFLTIKWLKLEKGSSFTGYVPNDYTNYGYDQGYSQGYREGSQETLSEFNAVRGYRVVGSNTIWFNDVYLSGSSTGYFSDWPENATIYVNSSNVPFFTYNNEVYEFFNVPHPTGPYAYQELLINWSSYSYTFTARSQSGYATIPIATNIAYVDGPAYFCTDFAYYQNNCRLVIRRINDNQIVFVDSYTISAYYNNIPVMDLSQYLTGGFFYDFYIVSKTKGDGTDSGRSSITFTTHNSYYTGINSMSIIQILNDDVLGQSAYEEGRKAGYKSGKDAGYWEGYGDGYSQGELVAPADGQYSFLGVIGALFDAPIGALRNFLDFDLLGFNMKSFVFAMLTLAFIVLIIRLILGSKS